MHNKQPSLVLWQLTDRGFCSEICVMLMARLYALANNYDFALSSRYANITWQQGWQDYFEPFCGEINGWPLRWHLFRVRNRLRAKLMYRAQQALLGQRFVNPQEVFRTCWGPEFAAQKFTVPSRGWREIDTETACRELLNEMWRINCATRERLAPLQQQLELQKKPFATLHIRRGDKIKEVVDIAPEKYIALAQRIAPAIKRFMIMSDDFRVVSDIRQQFPQFEFFTLCDANKEGHLQKKFNALSPLQRRQEIDTLLAELEAAGAAKFFVGTYSSNIARFMALRYGQKFTHGVDGSYSLVSPRYRGPRKRS